MTNPSPEPFDSGTNGASTASAISDPSGPATATFWERVATDTTWGRYVTAAEERAIRAAVRATAGPRLALEIGCDGGRWARLLSAGGWQMTCTDVDPAAVERCARRVPDARVVAVDPSARRLPCADGSMGLVLCIEVVDVVHSDWFAAEVARVLSSGGMLVAVAWNRRSLRGSVAVLAHRLRHGAPHPFYRWSYGPWRCRLVQAGFDVVQERGLCWFPFGRESNSPLVPTASAVESAMRLTRLPSLSPWVLVTARRR